jgi:hypothetical protein
MNDQVTERGITETVRRIDEAATQHELDVIGRELTPQEREAVCLAIVGREAEPRPLGQGPRRDTLSKNRGYFHLKFCR